MSLWCFFWTVEPTAAQPAEMGDDATTPAETLLAPETEQSARVEAAARLLERDRTDSLIRALGPAAPDGALEAAAVAIAEATDEPVPPQGEVLAALIDALARSAPEQKTAVLSALARYHDRRAVRAVIETLESSDRPGLALLAAATLAAQTGRDDLGADPEKWRRWWMRVRSLSEAEWKEQVARTQANRAQRLMKDRQALAQRLAEVYRELHAAVDQEARSELLVRMMGDDEPAVRRLAFDLAQRALANARRLDGDVAEAALSRLQDSEPDLRIAAARLVSNLAPPEAGTFVLEALDAEQNPEAAAALLAAVPDQLDREAAVAALQWLKKREPAASAAAETLLTAAQRGRLQDPALRREALSALRKQAKEGALSPAMVRLFGRLATANEAHTFKRLLESEAAEVRSAAAEALATRPEWTGLVIAAAKKNPDLHEAAASCLARWRPNAEGFRALLSLPAPDETTARQVRGDFAAGLPPENLLLAARLMETPAERAALLAPAAERARNGSPPALGSLRRLALALAEARLDLNESEEALAALALCPEEHRGSIWTGLRVQALLISGQLDEAEQIDAPPEPWLDGLARCVALDLEHTEEVREAIRAHFSDRLSPAERQRLGELGDPGQDGESPDRLSQESVSEGA